MLAVGEFKEVDKGFETLKKGLINLRGLRLVVGYQGAKAQIIHEGSNINIATLAALQEFGTATSPERPFLRGALLAHQDELVKLYREAVTAVLDGADPVDELAEIGKQAVGWIRERIDASKQWATPLADATVKAKGHDQPLVESGIMQDNSAWAVLRGETVIRQGTI